MFFCDGAVALYLEGIEFGYDAVVLVVRSYGGLIHGNLSGDAHEAARGVPRAGCDFGLPSMNDERRLLSLLCLALRLGLRRGVGR